MAENRLPKTEHEDDTVETMRWIFSNADVISDLGAIRFVHELISHTTSVDNDQTSPADTQNDEVEKSVQRLIRLHKSDGH
ncbi:MAG: hypothetical protein AAF362_06725 [Pseudomonadota bacterium]